MKMSAEGIQGSRAEQLDSLHDELEKLVPEQERALAEELLAGEAGWPEY